MTDKLTIAIVGATGRTGVPLVEAALARGHAVRALSRSKKKADGVLVVVADVVVGDATDPDAIARLVDGADVVIDVSGPVRGGPTDYRRRSTEVLLNALADRSDVRLLHLTGAGVQQPGDQPGVLDRLVRLAMGLMAKPLLEDSTGAVEGIQASSVPSLVVRVPRLTDGERTGEVRVTPAVGGGSGMRITRQDLADGLLDLAEVTSWPEGSPVLSA